MSKSFVEFGTSLVIKYRDQASECSVGFSRSGSRTVLTKCGKMQTLKEMRILKEMRTLTCRCPHVGTPAFTSWESEVLSFVTQVVEKAVAECKEATVAKLHLADSDRQRMHRRVVEPGDPPVCWPHSGLNQPADAPPEPTI